MIGAIATTLNILWDCVLRFVSNLVPRRPNMVVCGAHYGDTYSSNPKYLFEYLARNTAMSCHWIGNEEIKDHLPEDLRPLFVRRGSFKAFFLSLLAKYWVCDHEYSDITRAQVFGGARLINLWHGIPLKRMGRDTRFAKLHSIPKTGLRAIRSKVYGLLRAVPKYYTSVSSDKMAEIMEVSNECFSADRIVKAGSPRNDFLMANATNFRLIRDIKLRLKSFCGSDGNKRIVLYMPTWRMTKANVFSFLELTGEQKRRLDEILMKNNAIILEKHHPYTYKFQKFPETEQPSMFLLSRETNQHFDPQELFIAADALVTDYSSSYIDFALLKRPCIHFAYDLDEYSSRDSGLAYRYEDVVAGQIVKSVDKLIDAIDAVLQNPVFMPARGFHDLVTYESGNASRIVYEELMH